MSLAQKTLKNSLYNVAGWIWPIGLSIVTLPYIVHRLGTDAFGILVITSSLMGYFSFLNLGMGHAVVKYVAEYHAQKEIKAINKIIGSTLVIYLIMGIAGMSILLGLTDLLVTKLFKMPPELKDVAKFALYIASIGFLVSMVSNVYSGVPRALQRFDVVNKISMVFGTLTPLLTVLVLYLGYGLKAVVLINFCIGIATFVTYIVMAKKLIPELQLGFAFDKNILKKLLSFGLNTMVTTIAGIFVYHLDRLLISIVVGTTGLTFYAIPQRLIRRFRELGNKTSAIIFPISSTLSSTGQLDRLKNIYFKASKLTLCLNIALFLPAILFSYKILYFWMGKEFADNGWMVMVLLGCANFIIACTAITTMTIFGCGRPGVSAVFAIFSGVLNLITIYPLLTYFGIKGAAIAILFCAILDPVYIAYSNKKVIGVSNIDFLTKVCFKPVMVGVFQAVIIQFLLVRLVSSIWTLLPVFFASILIYFILSYIFFVFDEEEKMVFSKFASAMLAR